MSRFCVLRALLFTMCCAYFVAHLCSAFLAQTDFVVSLEAKSLRRTCCCCLSILRCWWKQNHCELVCPRFCHTPTPTLFGPVLPSCNLIVCPRFVANRQPPTLCGPVLPSCNLIVGPRFVANPQPIIRQATMSLWKCILTIHQRLVANKKIPT